MRSLVLIVAVVLVLVLMSAVFVVSEPEQVIVTRFGKPVRDPITTPGLKLKLPWPFEETHSFDKRFLEWDGDANQVPTRDKRFIWVDTYARWRITDPLLFFQRLKDERGAQTRLDDILDGETRNSVANHDLVEVVRSTNRTPSQEGILEDEAAEPLAPIEYGREVIRQEILAKAQTRTTDLGIEILDVRFKRINYVEEDREKIYDRMISERKRIATRYRSEGDRDALRIRGEMERDLKQIRSEAFREAEEIRGRADATATEIYAGAYDRSADSRAFYEFLKTMETFQQTVDPETLLILSTDGEFYRYLKDSSR